MKTQMRCVNVKGALYFRAEDVAKYLRELGDTEPTDTRTRLDEAAESFDAAAKKTTEGH